MHYVLALTLQGVSGEEKLNPSRANPKKDVWIIAVP